MNKNLTEQDLLNLKKEIDNSKTELATLEGEKTSLMKRLKKDYNCNTVEEADKKCNEYATSINELSAKITKAIEDLQTNHPIINEL